MKHNRVLSRLNQAAESLDKDIGEVIYGNGLKSAFTVGIGIDSGSYGLTAYGAFLTACTLTSQSLFLYFNYRTQPTIENETQ